MIAPAADAEQVGSKQRRAAAGFLDTGFSHTCVILTGGKVRCWGTNGSGQLGYGNTTAIGDTETPGSVGPVPLGAGRRAFALAVGFAHTCALLDNGRVRCWGDAGNGRIGSGSIDSIGDTEPVTAVGPVSLGSGRRAVAISAGDQHTCAVLDTGKVLCWGYGAFGRLGYGNTNTVGDNELPSAVGPVPLGAGLKAAAISAGGFVTCVLLQQGTVKCWGDGFHGISGQGNPITIGDNETPAAVGTVFLGRKAVAISAGLAHACAILDNGKVRCWGQGALGRLGYGNVNDIGDNELPGFAGPVDIGTDRKAVAISSGGEHTCVILDTGKVRCWGDAADGRLGYGDLNDIGDNETPGGFGPVDLGLGRTAVAISTGEVHSCALLDTGKVRCWGNGAGGRLGYGNTAVIGDTETPGGFGPVVAGGLVPTKVRPGLSLALKPRRDGSAPYRFVAKGKLSGFIGDSATCSGKLTVRARKGSARVVRHPLLKKAVAGCSYSASFRVSSAGTWKVTTAFAGNGSLRARSTLARSFSAG